MWRALCGESISRSARLLRASSAASTSNSKPPQACSSASLRSAAGWQEPVRWFASEPALEPEIREIKSPKLEKIVEEICGLNLLEVADLTELLQKRLNLNPAILAQSFAPAQGAVPAQAAAAEVAAEPEKTEFDVKLTGYEAAAKIKIIKEVRGITALGLKEAKDLVEKAPVTIKSSLKKEEADELVKKLEAVGAKVALE